MKRIAVAITTIANSLNISGCTVVRPEQLPVVGVYARAELMEPQVPSLEVPTQSGQPMRLAQLLAFADAHAPIIQSERARALAAGVEQLTAGIILPANPQFGLGVGGRSVGGESGVEFELSLEQRLEVAGERALRVDAANAEQHRAQARLNEVRWATQIDVHRLFLNHRLAEERATQAQRFVRFATSLEAIAKAKVDAGETAPLNLLVASADVARARELQVEANRVKETLAARLMARVGWPDDQPLETVGELPKIHRASDVRTLMARMVKNHPTLRTQELTIAARRAQLTLAEREAWPEPTLGLSYGREATPGPDPDAHVWLVSVGLPLPLWRTNQGGVGRASAALRLADRRRSEIMKSLRLRLSNAAIAVNAAVDRVTLYREGVLPQLEENLRLLQKAYELGEVDILQVSQMRQRLLDANAQYLDARGAYYQAHATLQGLVSSPISPDKAK